MTPRRRRSSPWRGILWLGALCLLIGAGAAWIFSGGAAGSAGSREAPLTPAEVNRMREAELRRELLRQQELLAEQERRLTDLEIQILLEKQGSRTNVQ